MMYLIGFGTIVAIYLRKKKKKAAKNRELLWAS